MKQRILGAALLGAALVTGSAVAEPKPYQLDESHIAIVWSVDHLGLADVIGHFLEVEGGFTYDEAAGTVSDMTVTIQADSVFSNHDRRDGHLRSDDFLSAENHPEITFVSTSSEMTSENTGLLHGDLTLLGVTEPVTLEVTKLSEGVYPFGSKHFAIGYKATTTIKRSDFGMMYAVENGVVGDEVDILIEGEAILME